ncbi:MAG: PIG-L family deacetylase [Pseudomonadota bacterium]|nr:PIG-L family deacetylase [Pseudomonadota bacterium]
MTTRPDTVSLYFFAHQDDELWILPRLEAEAGRGIRAICFFLTSGSTHTRDAGRQLALARNEESRGVLVSHGCRDLDIHFLGLGIPIDDGSLFRHLEAADDACTGALQPAGEVAVHTIYCPAWEGGHPDHDAVHLIALSQAIRLAAASRLLQFPLYNGRSLPGPLFRTQSPLPENGPVSWHDMTRYQAIRHWLLARRYRTQWRTWMGLLPPSLLKAAWTPGLALQPVDRERVSRRPHPGPLFYEKRFGVSYPEFADISRGFIESRIYGNN